MDFRVVLLLLFLGREWHLAEADCRKQLWSDSDGVAFSDCYSKRVTGENRTKVEPEYTSITCAQEYGFEGKEVEWFDAPDDVEYIAIVDIDIPEDVTVTIHHIVDFDNECKILKLKSDANGREKVIIKLQPPYRKFKISATKPTATLKFICNRVRQCTKPKDGNYRMKRMVRGQEADKNEYPFMARINTLWSNTRRDYSECNTDAKTDPAEIWELCNNNVVGKDRTNGGSIINNKWVLTTAEAVTKPGLHLIGALVYLGDHLRNIDDGEEVYWVSTKAEDIIRHPDSEADFFTDLALLQLDREITFDEKLRYPICLAPLNMDDLIGCKVHAAGWGQTETKALSDELRKEKNGPFEIYLDPLCAARDHTICFRHEETNACSGDTGGPLFCDSANDFYYQVGVIIAMELDPVDIWKKGGIQLAGKVTSFLKWINKNAGYLP